MKIIESASRNKGSEVWFKFESGHTAVWSKYGILGYFPNGRWVDNRCSAIRKAIKQAIYNNFR